MDNKKISAKERYVRGIAPKISLVLTGIETFGVLALAVMSFILGRVMGSNANSLASSTTDSLSEGMEDLLASGLDEIIFSLFTLIAVILLIYGIWSIIFWLICLKSKYRRRRDIICTFLGRLPGLILGILLLLTGSLGMLFLMLSILLLAWAVLMILLSAFGWREREPEPVVEEQKESGEGGI